MAGAWAFRRDIHIHTHIYIYIYIYYMYIYMLHTDGWLPKGKHTLLEQVPAPPQQPFRILAPKAIYQRSTYAYIYICMYIYRYKKIHTYTYMYNTDVCTLHPSLAPKHHTCYSTSCRGVFEPESSNMESTN